ncbi:transglycosylase SLT domain-containing protein [Desulfobacterales bacterium HSG16]|nr:transglycosylase SLT domain-containing protein [Desulfobacterales bacterium HSG16]
MTGGGVARSEPGQHQISIENTEPIEFLEANWPYTREDIHQALAEMFETWHETAFSIDDELVRHVFYFYKYYSVIERVGSNKVIERSKKYFPGILPIFQEYKLPEELAFAVPFVESAFKNKARSGKKAVGLFQFLRKTAQSYGLKVTKSNDERTNYKKAAVACAKYLSENRNIFASTVLSLGSFHHGTNKLIWVLRRLPMKENKRRFVSIFNNRNLGKYSKEYIPKCLAASLIYKFLKDRQITAIPKIHAKKKRLKRFKYVKELRNNLPDLYALNPDLQDVITTYQYATTRGYLMVREVSYKGQDMLVAKTDMNTKRHIVEMSEQPLDKKTKKQKSPDIINVKPVKIEKVIEKKKTAEKKVSFKKSDIKKNVKAASVPIKNPEHKKFTEPPKRIKQKKTNTKNTKKISKPASDKFKKTAKTNITSEIQKKSKISKSPDLIKPDKIKSDKIKSDKIKSDKIKSDKIKSDKIKSDKIKSDKIKPVENIRFVPQKTTESLDHIKQDKKKKSDSEILLASVKKNTEKRNTIIDKKSGKSEKPDTKQVRIPALIGNKWNDNIRGLYKNREIIMNESYNGNIREIGIIFDQNLKTGDMWTEDMILILEVGRPPEPEDDLTTEEYSKFIREYMLFIRKVGKQS